MGKKSKSKNKCKEQDPRANTSSDSRMTSLPSHNNNGTPLALASSVPIINNTSNNAGTTTTTLLIQALQCGTGCSHGTTAADLGSIPYISAFVEDFCPERGLFSTYMKIYDAVKKDGLDKIPPDTTKAMCAIGTNLMLSLQTTTIPSIVAMPTIVMIAKLIAKSDCYLSDENATFHAYFKHQYKVDSLKNVVAFYAKRIPCHCLDTILTVCKANCSNTFKCKNCEKHLPKSQLAVCGQCCLIKYCSKKCQREHWPEHKVDCNLLQQFKKKQQTMTP